MESKRVRKLDGKYIRPRGSNKKYEQLNDLDALFEMLKRDCPADVARQLGVPYNSVRHLIVTYFADKQQEIAWKRARHTKNPIIRPAE